MNPRRVLEASFWAMILLQTLGSIDLPGKPSKGSPLGGKGTRKMPAPRAYVAVIVLWTILGLVAETSADAARMAARLSLLVVLAGAVLGPFGAQLVALLNGISSRFGIAPPAGASGSSSPGAGALQTVEVLT